MIAEEQEVEERRTLLVANDLDGVVRIWSAQSRYIPELRHNANFTEIKSGHIDDTDTEWVEFPFRRQTGTRRLAQNDDGRGALILQRSPHRR